MTTTVPFRIALGEVFDQLPEAIRLFHEGSGARFGLGWATVERRRNPIAGLLADFFGFPKPCERAALEVAVTFEGGKERWVRNIGGARFHSVLGPVEEGVLWERFGPVSGGISLSFDVERKTLFYRVTRWRLFGFLPYPNALAPTVEAWEEAQEGGGFSFSVEIVMPVIGLLVRYGGAVERVYEGG